jgi:putative ABC transport system substrate-binding protein
MIDGRSAGPTRGAGGIRIVRAAAVAALALIAAPLAVEGQPAKVPRIGALSGDGPSDSPCVERLRASRFAVLRLPGGMQDLVVRDMEAAGRQLGVQLQVIEVRRVEDLTPAFDAAMGGHAQAVMSTQGPFFLQNNVRIAQLALKHRLPNPSGEPNAAEDGAFLFYGPSMLEGCARAARYVDRILKGARPADLPVEQPTRIDFVINLKTVKALGVTVAPSLLQRADRVIQRW